MSEMLIKRQKILIDPIDHKWASKLKWGISGGYVRRDIKKNGKNIPIMLHRCVLEKILDRPLLAREFTDHINRNKFDNRRSNLRLATRGQNQANSVRKNKSGFRGVKRNDRGLKWRAVITYNQKKIFVGNFQTAQGAALAYNLKARELFGEFATLNTLSPSDSLSLTSRILTLELQVEKLTNWANKLSLTPPSEKV